MPDADDARLLADALARCGVALRRDGEVWRIAPGPLIGGTADAPLDIRLGNAGTAVRFFTAFSALSGRGHFRVDGDARMRERPLAPLLEALAALGARFDAPSGAVPVTVNGSAGDAGGACSLSGRISSQFASALLLAAPATARGVELTLIPPVVSKPYIALTAALLARHGVAIEETAGGFRVAGGQRPKAGAWTVEADASAATYVLAAHALAGSEGEVVGVGSASLQGDVGFARVLRAMGCTITLGDHHMGIAGRARLTGTTADFTDIPDTAMTAAVLACFARGPSTFTGLSTLRGKETDRVAAMAAECGRLGAAARISGDTLHIAPSPPPVPPVVFDTYADHRMAMAFSLASLRAPGCAVRDPGCVAKSWPSYFADMGMTPD